MNAYVRVTAHLESHSQEFSRHDVLCGHTAQQAKPFVVALAEADANEDIAPGYKEGLMFLERFNWRSTDLLLFVDDAGAPDAPPHLRTDFEETGSV